MAYIDGITPRPKQTRAPHRANHEERHYVSRKLARYRGIAAMLSHHIRRLPSWSWLALALLVILGIFLFLQMTVVHADTQGPNSPGTAGTNSSGTTTTCNNTTAWTSTSNALASDSVYSTVSLASGASSNCLTVTNFGFSIPSGSVINGIQADIEKWSATSSKGTMQDNAVLSIKGGTPGGTNLGTTSTWPASNSFVTYGSSSSLWGQTWAVTDINASTFGIAISAKNVKIGGGATLVADVDYVQVTVTYTPPQPVLGQTSFRVFNNADSATAPTSFVNAWGGSSNQETGSGITATSDGGYAVVGFTSSFGASPGLNDIFIAKYTAAGQLQWSRTWGGGNQDYGYAITQNPNDPTNPNSLTVVGYTQSTGFGPATPDIVIANYTSSGTFVWAKTWGGTGQDNGYGITATSDGGYAVTGKTYNCSNTNGCMFIAKFTSTGVASWSHTWGSATSSSGETGYGITQNPNDPTNPNSLTVVGYTTSFGGNYAFLANYKADGTFVWAKTWGGSSGTTIGYGITATSDGGYAVTGRTTSFGDTNGDTFIAKFTSTGAASWSHTWGGTGTESLPTSGPGAAITQNPNDPTNPNSLTVVSITNSFGAGVNDAFLANYKADGTFVWAKTWGGTGQDYGYGITATSDGGYAVTGQTASYGDTANGDAFIAKYTSTGTIAGCTNTSGICKADGTDFTSTKTTPASPVIKSDGTDFTSTRTNPTATLYTDGSNFTATHDSDVWGGGSNYTSTLTVVVAESPTIDVGSPLAALNTAATTPGDGVPFRVRVDVGVTNAQLNASGQLLALQYAPMTTSCDANFTNTLDGTYQDVTNTSTIRFYDNTNAASGMPMANDANDPTDSTNTLNRQTYQEYNTTVFTNTSAIPAGQDGMWDFALTTYHALQNTSYCLRIVLVSGSTYTKLNSYTASGGGSAVVQLNIPNASFTQSSYRIFQAGSPLTGFAIAGSSSTINKAYIGYSMVQTTDGGYIVVGDYQMVNGVLQNDLAFIAKYTSNGSLSWTNSWGSGTANEIAYAVIQTSDGGFAVAGTTSSYGAGSADLFLLKYTSGGTLSWNVTWGTTNDDEVSGVAQTTDSGYVVSGYIALATDSLLLVKFTSAGAVSWANEWNLSSQSTAAYGVTATSDGGCAVTGFANSGVSSSYLVLLKVTSTGTLSWYVTWGGSGTNEGKAVVQTSDGGYAVAGFTSTYGAGSDDVVLLKYDSSGNLTGGACGTTATCFQKTWGGTQADDGESLAKTSDGGYVVGGITASYGNGNSDALIIKFDSSGNATWRNTFGGTGQDDAYAVTQTSDGGYAIAGDTSSYGMNGPSLLLVKYDNTPQLANCGSICTAPSVTAVNQTGGTVTITPSWVADTGTTTNPTGAASTLTPTTTNIVYPYTATVGAPLANMNKPYDIPNVNKQIRVRMLIGVVTSGVAVSGQSFKLQYAVRGSDNQCDAAGVGETYADVTTSTPIAFYDGSGSASNDGLVANANDPTDGTNTVVPETYQESNNFSNAASVIYAGQDGEWDFSLAVPAGTLPAKDFCLKAVAASGTPTITYTQLAETSHGPSMMDYLLRQGAWFSRNQFPLYNSGNNKENYFLHGQ